LTHLLDEFVMVIEKIGDGLEDGIEFHALLAEGKIGEVELPVTSAGHVRGVFLLLADSIIMLSAMKEGPAPC
jgi:hypothetical protein